MKKLAISIISVILTFSSVTGVWASANNVSKANNNPNVVAYYPTGIHAIPGNPITYVTGTDLVMMRGNTGEIQAWYTGADNHGIHSVWNISKNSSCPSDWVLVQQAYPNWGTYLTPGADYCVHNNAF